MAAELPPETALTVTTLFCDGGARWLSFRRRRLGRQFYALRVKAAEAGQIYPRSDTETQHIVLITMIERDPLTDQVVQTGMSRFFDCPHQH